MKCVEKRGKAWYNTILNVSYTFPFVEGQAFFRKGGRPLQKIQNPKVRLTLLALLILIQAAGLLLFPIGVKQMADVGFRQSGMRYATPLQLRAQTLEDLRIFLAPGDYKTIHDAYTEENGVCTLNDRADLKALSGVFAEAERLYLRTTQRGGNAMAAARAALESGAMTQSQILEQAREGLNENLTPAQEQMAAVAFLRAEYSVLGLNPDAMRAHYLRNWTWALIGCAAAVFLAARGELKLRREEESKIIPVSAAKLLLLAGDAALLIWGLIALGASWVKPGALAMAAVALTQAALALLPAALRRKAGLEKPKSKKEIALCVLPAAAGTVGAVMAVLGASLASKSMNAVNAGLNRVLANTGGTDGAAVRQALIPGLVLVLVGCGLLMLARQLDKNQRLAWAGPLQTLLEILPGLAGSIMALILILARRYWLGVLLLVALAAAVGLMAWVQNRRPERVVSAVRLPGMIACAMTAGLGANLLSKTALDPAGFLVCVVGALVFTRTAAKLLTRR